MSLPRTHVVYVASAPGAAPRAEERPLRAPADDELVLEVEGAVVGPAELAALDRGGSVVPGGAAVGVVIAAGAAAEDCVGKRAVIGAIDACGECAACRRGRLGSCPTAVRRGETTGGALASHVIARRRWALLLDGPLAGVAPGVEAALLGREALLAYTMIVRAGVSPSDATIWIGGGAIAALGLPLARAKGAAAVAPAADLLACPPDELARVLAERIAGGDDARSRGDQGTGEWRVFECSGRAAGRRTALGLAARAASVTLLAGATIGHSDDEPLALDGALDADVPVLGVASAHPDLAPELAALVKRGELDLAAVCERRDVAGLAELVRELRAGQLPGRAAVVAVR